ncbi:MAG TPA: Gfo/Idh/MocA family oxidoreductase [Kribbella sp.]|nr:Gfo/Idh/MocA family oxidoreductase [Kribbella sp.]
MRTDHGLRVLRLGLIGAGRIGTMHAGNLARKIPGAELAAVADPRAEAAEGLAAQYDARATSNVDDVLKDPELDAVVITSIAAAHTELIVKAAEQGKAIFCEKPMALTLEEADTAIAATRQAKVPLQIGFNRRFAKDFAAARDTIVAGGIGMPQLLRSLTRDPGWPAGLSNAAGVKPWTIFRETLIHDFDLLRWFNPGAAAVEVYTRADALVAPEFKDNGLLDTAVVMVTFDNGAIATAEASFSALYGYDVRGEAFGSKGMVTAGRLNSSPMVHYHAGGLEQPTLRSDVEMFEDAYVKELVSFTAAVRDNTPPEVTGEDAREALRIALAAMRSHEERRPVQLQEIR